MTANPPSGPSSSSGPWYPPVPSLAALPVDQTKTTPKPAYYKLQFGDDYTGFSYYVRTLNVVIGRNCERVVPPPDQLEPGVPTNPPLPGDDGLPSSSIAGLDGWSQGVAQDSAFGQDIKPTDGLDLSILGNGILDSFAPPPTIPPLDATANLHPDFQLHTEDVKPTIPASPVPPSPGRAHTTPPESHSHTHLNGDSIAQPPLSAPPSTSHLHIEPESYFDPVFAPPAPPPPPMKKSGPVEHVDVDLGPLKSVSRNHAKIEYHTELGHFCLEIIGRNGAWVDDRYYVKGSTVPLNQGSQIQIATRIFSFILPPSADPSPYSSYGHEDTANALEDVPYPYNLPPGEVGYAEFYGEPGPGPSSVANMMGRIPPAFNVFAGGDGLGMGIEGVDGKVWDDEWDNSDDSDSEDDQSYDEDEDEEDGQGEEEAVAASGTVPKVKIRLKGDKAILTPDRQPTGEMEGDGETSGVEDKKKARKGSIKEASKPHLPEEPKPGKGKGGKTTTKATKKKVAKAEEGAEDSAMDVDPSPAPEPAASAVASTQTTPIKAKKDKPSAKKESKKKKNSQPVEIKPNPASAPPAPVVATLADALAEAPAPAPAPAPTPAAPPTLAAAGAAPTSAPAKPVPNVAQPPAKPPAAANQPPSGAAATAHPAQPKPVQPGQPAKPAPSNAPQRPSQAAIPPQLQKATPATSPAATPTRQNSSSAPPEPPKPFFLTELIETPGRPGHIVVNVPIPPSGAGPRPPPGPLIGLDGKPFIGPPPIKPTATFATIIHRALLFLPRGRGTLGEVCNWVAGEWEWFRLNIDAGWQNSIRHNLSLNKAFLKVPRIPEDDPESKGSVWIIDPEEGPLFEEKQRRDALKSAGKEKNAEVRRERERQKVEERARKQREMALEAHAAHGPHATGHGLGGNHAKPVLPRPTPIPPRPMQRAQAPTAVSANAKGLLQPKAKISVSIQTLTPAHRAKSVIATTDSSGNPLPFACDGTTLTLDQATFGHLTGDIIDKLTLLGAAGAVDVLSAWVINKNKNQAARAAQQAAAAQASSKPTAASIKAGLTAPRNGAIATPPAASGAAAAAKPIPKKPVAAAPGASGQKFGPAPPGASLTKVIGMIAEVANAKGDVNTVGPNAGALLRYIRVVGVDIDLRVAERIWATGVVPPLPAKKAGPAGAAAGKPNGTAAAPPARPIGAQSATAGGPAASGATMAKPAGQPAQAPKAATHPGPLAPALAPGAGGAGVGARPAVAAAPNGPVKRKLEDGPEAEDAKKAKVEAAL